MFFSSTKAQRANIFAVPWQRWTLFVVVDSYIKANNNKNNQKGTYCCLSMDKAVTRTRHGVTCTYTMSFFQLAASQQNHQCLVLI